MELADYRDAIDLDEPHATMPDPRWRTSVGEIARVLGVRGAEHLAAEDALRQMRGTLSPLPPGAVDPATADRIEAINAAVTRERGTVEVGDAPTISEMTTADHRAADTLAVVVGDITALRVDAIVNAANARMLGCFIPHHACVDNAIHAAAGPRLRDDCATVMGVQGHLESEGTAKITRAYALPAGFVLHTVGPQLRDGRDPTPTDDRQLADCYRSCLDLASEVDAIRTVAFSGISTGVFAFPRPRAAAIALDAIADWVTANPGRLDRVIVNCFTDDDADVYAALL